MTSHGKSKGGAEGKGQFGNRSWGTTEAFTMYQCCAAVIIDRLVRMGMNGNAIVWHRSPRRFAPHGNGSCGPSGRTMKRWRQTLKYTRRQLEAHFESREDGHAALERIRSEFEEVTS